MRLNILVLLTGPPSQKCGDRGRKPPLETSQNSDHLGPWTRDELDEAIGPLKNNKTPGPDGIPAELFKMLTDAAREKLLSLYNNLWGTDQLPRTMNESIIAAIYKIGKDPWEYSNYRPIALLNVTYKVLAKMIEKRL